MEERYDIPAVENPIAQSATCSSSMNSERLLTFIISLLLETRTATLILVGLIVILYLYYKSKFGNLWKSLGVPYVPWASFLSSDFFHFVRPVCRVPTQLKIYSAYKGKGQRFVGTFVGNKPTLFVSDLELIEEITVGSFASFHDRSRVECDVKTNPLLDNLMNASGDKWKALRSKLSPTFSNAKLKTMHGLLLECGDDLAEKMVEYAQRSEPVDIKEIMGQFGADVIGACVFGLRIDSLKNPHNQFRKMGKRAMTYNAQTGLRTILWDTAPWLAALLRIKLWPTDVERFFMEQTERTVQTRETAGSDSNDFIQLLINLRKQDIDGGKKQKNSVGLNNRQMSANAFVFFIAGLVTTSSALAYCLFELAQNEDVQEKLRQDILATLNTTGGQCTYEALNNIPYMNQVINEALRKYPPVHTINRLCTADYPIPGTDIVLPKGSVLELPVYSIHNDPDIYPQPEMFKPERFSEENIGAIPKGAFLPFGRGPRICIGQRFALMEMQVALVKLVPKFKITKHATTPSTFSYDKKEQILLVPEGKIMLNFEKC